MAISLGKATGHEEWKFLHLKIKFSDKFWYTGAPFFCYQLIKKKIKNLQLYK